MGLGVACAGENRGSRLRGRPGRLNLQPIQRLRRPRTKTERIGRWQQLVERRIADLDYLAAERFEWREGVMLVWAGMRGAFTIAAAHTLPEDTENRALIILAATLVAVGTLVIQGPTPQSLARRLGLETEENDFDPELWHQLQTELDSVALQSLPQAENDDPDELLVQVRTRLSQSAEGAGKNWFDLRGEEANLAWAKFREHRLASLDAQRRKRLDRRALGTYPSAMLDDALAQLDAHQVSIELRQQFD